MDSSWTVLHNRRALPALIVVVSALALACFVAPAAIAAEGERVLDPELSLIGGCKAEELDPVEDPGCPYPPFPAGPSGAFANPRAVATDDYGNVYVSSFGNVGDGSKGRIDVFCSDGTFISELAVPGSTSLAIDSEGNLYVFSTSQEKVLRFKPDAGYQPEACEIEYGISPVLVRESLSIYAGLAINRDDDHLFANFGSGGVIEFSAAAEGNGEVRSTPAASWSGGSGMAIDAARERMYASSGPTEERIDVFDLNAVEGTPPNDRYKVIDSILPSSVPAKDFGTQLSIAANEGDGHVFVLDGENCRLYEFDQSGAYLRTIEFPFVCTPAEEIAIDNGPFSPNGALSDKGRYLYVPSHRTGTGHSFAFFESTQGPPEVKSTSSANPSEDEAELRAQIDPNNLETSYSFEYVSEQAAQQNEEELEAPFAGATLAGEGTLAASNLDSEVSAPATGLSPGTSYRFRVIAANEEGFDEAEDSFATYPSAATESEPCPNAQLRSGPSALLPDCRAYELVTPADTNARAPLGAGGEGGVFATRQVSPEGDKVPFRVEGGSLPGFGGTGSLVGDPYLASRTPGGWSTAYTGPDGDEATVIAPGTTSPDQGYLFWWAGEEGSAVLAPTTAYVRYPDGHSELVGQGSLGIDPESSGKLISEGGGHIVFGTGSFASTSTAVQLEPDAAPSGTAAVYDRTADGVTHTVSVKPDGTAFGTGENAIYQGASADGEGIAFKVGNTLYLRYQNEETLLVGTGVDFAGVAEGGGRVFHVEGDDLKALDVEGGVIDFSQSGDVTPVTVAADGTTAYFVSPSVLGGPNPEGDEAQAGEQNLYRSVEGQVEFIGTVTDRDVDGQASPVGDGLGLWVEANQQLPQGRLGLVPARSTPDGDVFLFKSRADLTGYESEGHAQLYRYEAPAGELSCISCNPSGLAPSAHATLQSETREGSELYSAFAWPENLRADGRRAFFETAEPLVAGDGDGLQDVYEWEEQGVGSCKQADGCVYLISSPQSSRGEYLWAVSRSGNDAFFVSSELLTDADADGTPSIYDARVGGGFAESRVRAECLGEACQPSVAAPARSNLGSAALSGPGNVSEKANTRSCSQGRRKARRLAYRAKRLRRAARRTSAPRPSAGMRRGAARSARQARRLTRKAKRCRAQQRRAQR